MQTSRWVSGVGFYLFLLLVPVSAHTQELSRQVTLIQVRAAIPELEKFTRETLEKKGVPGAAIAIVFQDRVLYLHGFGVREAGKKEPVTEDTVFQLASMSKPIASTILAALVSDGVVTWDTPIRDVDPGFQLYEAYPTQQVTIRDLFAHRSGLPGNAGNDLEQLGYSRTEILYRLRHVKPASSFRSAYSYSNFGITEGAVAAAKPTGKPWGDMAAENLYKPLGMHSTSSYHKDFLAHTNRAVLHSLVNGKWAPKALRDPDAQSPAGGVSSTVKDLAQWMRLELANGKWNGRQLIGEEAIGQTHLPLIIRGNDPITGNPGFYGLGWNVDYRDDGTVVWGHAGAFSQGARTLVKLIPTEQLGIVVLSNAFPTGIPEGIAQTFFDYVYYGKARNDWVAIWDKMFNAHFGVEAFAPLIAMYAKSPVHPSPAMPLGAYVGAYTNDYIGPIQVLKRDGTLALQMGPKRRIFPLKHFDHDLFLYYPDPETPEVPSSVTFTIGPEQKAVQVVIADLNGEGLGTLTRVSKAE